MGVAIEVIVALLGSDRLAGRDRRGGLQTDILYRKYQIEDVKVIHL
jgi:hypothetical protein